MNSSIHFGLRTYDEFHQTYRVENSVLLIDDAQFFTGKERTQEELFHTFEFLTGKGNQIVFTADVLLVTSMTSNLG